MIEQINPKMAHQKMQDSQNPALYLDVRTIQEYQMGHADGAYNIPVMIADENGQMAANPNFVKQVTQKFSPQQQLVVGCKMGGRSQKACDLLEAAGFENLFNIQGGFGGSPTQAGWSQLDLPVEDGQPEGRAYLK